MKKKPSTLKDILFLSISSFIVVAAWVGFNIYHSYVTTTITPELQIQITPINPDFDTATLNELKLRQIVVPVSELSTPVIAQPTPTVVPTQPSSPQTAITPTPDAAQTQPIISDIPVTVDGQ